MLGHLITFANNVCIMSVQSIFRNLICLFSIVLASSLSYSDSLAGTIEGKVVQVAEGDTIMVLDSSKVQHRVRLAGIDAPEKGQPFGNASRKILRDLVSGKEVKVEYEKHDRYERIVGKVWITPPDCPACGKTLDVGLTQITTGMAWWFRRYAHEQSPDDQMWYELAEEEAKAKKVGLWQDKKPVPPWEFRHPQ